MDEKLFNKPLEDNVYFKSKELYQNHLLEQYKMYVEMADRISSRRNLANVFFLSLNTTLITVIGIALEKMTLKLSFEITLMLIISFECVCVVWWWLLRSYRNLNSAKYKVIGNLEKQLPSSPYWSAEWHELGEGKSLRKYLPLSFLEQFIPIIFFIFYLVLAIIVL